jgi:membrane fusion protein, multidrug efflux system
MPTAAVHRGAPNGVNSTFVYRIKEDSTAAVVPVKLGVADGETTGVLSGVSVGDVVVTEGGDRLRDGAPVELPSNTPNHTAPAKRTAGTGRHRGGSRRNPGANSFRPPG